MIQLLTNPAQPLITRSNLDPDGCRLPHTRQHRLYINDRSGHPFRHTFAMKFAVRRDGEFQSGDAASASTVASSSSRSATSSCGDIACESPRRSDQAAPTTIFPLVLLVAMVAPAENLQGYFEARTSRSSAVR